MTEQYIKYEARLYVMICRLCKTAITKNGIAWHYREHHKNLPLRTRKELVKYSNNFDLRETNELQYPSMIIPYIEELEVMEGLRCSYDGCNYACIEPNSMKQHCRPCHDWTASKGIISIYMTLMIIYRSYVDGV
jgi:Orsellinic acid/F9775 biosynthesis cluster protein D